MQTISACGFIFILLWSCADSEKEKDAVARVYDKYLPKKDVLINIPSGISPEDSMEMANDFIEQWIRKNINLKKAELNLTESQKDVRQQLDDYRSSLLIFAYEQELIKQKLDTNISDQEIEKYFKENPGNFELKNNIIKLKYIKLPIKTANTDKLKQWLIKNEKSKLEQYCRLNAVNYLLDDSKWILMDDVLKEIPLSDYTKEKFDNNTRFLEIRDNRFQYLILVSGFMIKETKAPLSFERNNIRNIILNKRKILLIEQMQKEAYQEAIGKKEIEKYETK